MGILEKIRNYKKILTILGRQTVYYQGLMLGDMNRKIYFTEYDFSVSNVDPKINVSFTTHGKRIFYVHYMLDSLYTQTLRPSKIFLYVTKGEYVRYPSILKKFEPWLQIIEVENLRSFKKIIPALLNAKEDELYVSLDDDFLYPPSMIEELYYLHLLHQNDFVSYAGFHAKKNNEYAGHAGIGVLWNPKVFNPKRFPSFFNVDFIKGLSKSNDDLYIARFLQQQGIKIFSCYDYFDVIDTFVPLPSSEINALSWRGGEKKDGFYITKDDNDLIVKQIDEYFWGSKK